MKNDTKTISFNAFSPLGHMGPNRTASILAPDVSAAAAAPPCFVSSRPFSWENVDSQQRRRVQSKYKTKSPAAGSCGTRNWVYSHYLGIPVPAQIVNDVEYPYRMEEDGFEKNVYKMDFDCRPRGKTTEEMIIDQTDSLKEIMYQLRVAAKQLKYEHEDHKRERLRVSEASALLAKKIHRINDEKMQAIELNRGNRQEIMNAIAKADRKIRNAQEMFRQSMIHMDSIMDGMNEIKARYAELLQAMEIQVANAKSLVVPISILNIYQQR